jgi:hypothetical protein
MAAVAASLAAYVLYLRLLVDWTDASWIGPAVATVPVLACGAATWLWQGRRARVATGAVLLTFSVSGLLSVLMPMYLPAAALLLAGGLATPREPRDTARD